MKKRKFLSIVLSLALVFSMTSAFTVATYADGSTQDENASNTPNRTYIAKAVDSVKVNDISLQQGQYICPGDTQATTGYPLFKNSYAYYNNGKLILNNFVLTDVTGHPGIEADSDNYDTYNALNIVLKGNNSITMKDVNEKEYSAIDADNLDLTISSASSDASLNLKSNDGTYNSGQDKTGQNYVDCVSSKSFELKSGKVTIAAGTIYMCDEYGNVGFDSAIYTDDGDVIVNGGELNIKSAAIAIAAEWSFMLNDGTVNIGVNENDHITLAGINARENSVVINKGNLTISNVVCEKSGNLYDYFGYSANANESVTISGGNVTIKDSDFGIGATRGDIIIDSYPTITIDNIKYSAMCSKQDIAINNANVKIDTAGKKYYYEYDQYYGCPAICAISNIDLSNSNISIDNVGLKNDNRVENEVNYGYGICSSTKGSKIVIDNCTINISDTTSCALYSGGTFSINDSSLSIDRAGVEDKYTGIWVTDDLAINNSTIDIDDVGRNCLKGSSVALSDSVLTLVGAYNAIYSITDITVKNCDLSALSNATEKGYIAFYPAVKIIGNPVVYAGSTENDATRVTDFTKLNNYQFVHIYKDGVTPQTGFAGIITKLFTWLKTFNTGSSFTNSPIWKIFSAIFKLS